MVPQLNQQKPQICFNQAKWKISQVLVNTSRNFKSSKPKVHLFSRRILRTKFYADNGPSHSVDECVPSNFAVQYWNNLLNFIAALVTKNENEVMILEYVKYRWITQAIKSHINQINIMQKRKTKPASDLQQNTSWTLIGVQNIQRHRH